MGHIKINEAGFNSAAGLQQTVIDDLRTGYEDMQGCLDHLSSAWQGESGEAFCQMATSVQQQMLVGTFELEQLRRETLAAKEQFVQRDQAVANLMNLEK